MEHELEKKINDLKKSIKELNQLSSNEKMSLIESIEMLWLNSNVRKKKKDLITADNSN